MSKSSEHSSNHPPRALIAGWFSFPGCNATAGDVMACDVLSRWLGEAGLPHDVARCESIGPALDWQRLDPDRYTHLFFVCGPFRDRPMSRDLLERFAHCRHIGINLSMIERLDDFNPFDLLYERDSDRTRRPDLVFAAEANLVPVVGCLLVHKQREYGDRGRHAQVHATIRKVLAELGVACVPIDTSLEENPTGLHTLEQVNAVIARVDLVVSTRMHGLVMALRNGVPAVAVDAISGGAKVLSQARSVDWPIVTTADDLSEPWLKDAVQRCLDPQIAELVGHSQACAAEQLDKLRRELTGTIRKELSASTVGANTKIDR